MSRLILVEDDERIGSSLQRALTSSQHEVHWLKTGESALGEISNQNAELVLLDLGLPDIDGMTLCKEIHQKFPKLPIMILTARQEESDLVAALDFGAIDYVTKPFSLATLIARINAHLRFSQKGLDSIEIGNLKVDIGRRKVYVSNSEILLRPKEFDLLARLAKDQGKVVTRESLMSDVWDENWFGSTKTLDFHIAGLRTKLEAAKCTAIISTSRSIGYVLELPKSS